MENKVVFVKRVDPPYTKDDVKDDEKIVNLGSEASAQLLQELYKESERSFDDLIPSRNLKKIKYENDVKKNANLVEHGSNKDRLTSEDLKSVDPISKLEKLESEFFSAKQELNKNIRLVENLKSKMYKTYQEMFPDLSIEEIKAKFTY